MDTQLLQKSFARMGARVKIRDDVSRRRPAGIDIQVDDGGEYFDIGVELNDAVEYQVIDIQPEMKHLLRMARRETGRQKFLCGHDERHWFVCAVPGNSVSNVVNAMEALQPIFVRGAVHRRVKRVKDRLRRKNKAFVRQGEWFFVPMQTLTLDQKLILKNEPLSRGFGSKPHMCQFLYRVGGEAVWVCRQHPQGVSQKQYQELILANPKANRWDWRQMMREPTTYVRGRISHRDHKTIVLNDWHRVLMNTEREAPGARSVVFLD